MVRFAAYRPTRRRLKPMRPTTVAPAPEVSPVVQWFRRSLLLAPGLGPILFVAIAWATWFRGPATETSKPTVDNQGEVARTETTIDAPTRADSP